jgi:hypothetical protein
MELFERITTMTSRDLGRSNCTPTLFAKKSGAIKLRMVPAAYDWKMMELLLIIVQTIQDHECGFNGRNLAAIFVELLVRRLPAPL